MSLAVFWYGIVPVFGAFQVRKTWREFRKRFEALRLAPILDYRTARLKGEDDLDFRFFGGFESVSDETLWVRGPNLTVPVELEKTQIFLLPAADDESSEESERAPRRIKWKEVSQLSEGVSVFVGGRARSAGGRIRFENDKAAPLLVILYDGSERAMLYRAVRAGRQTNEYWNPVTPFALALGVFCQCVVALLFAGRPAFGSVISAAVSAATIPLLPLVPPGLALLALYKSCWAKARRFRSLRDIVQLPLRHAEAAALPDGSPYGFIVLSEEERRARAEAIPDIPSVEIRETANTEWRCYGTLITGSDGGSSGLMEPADPTAVFAAIPGDPEKIAARFSAFARVLEIGAAASLLAGIALNGLLVFFLIETIRGLM